MHCKLGLGTILTTALALQQWHVEASKHTSNIGSTEWYENEVAYLAKLKSRLTGSPNHNKLIDHIQAELEGLGLYVYSDTYNFTYIDQPSGKASLELGGDNVEVSSHYPYSGKTEGVGVQGKLVDLVSASTTPDWEKAKGHIAVLNMTNPVWNLSSTFALWPNQPPWYLTTANPSGTADAEHANLTAGRLAGVRGVVYFWEHFTAATARGQYVPFKELYQSLPTLFVAGGAGEAILSAAKQEQTATLSLPGRLLPNTSTRTIWAVFEGTKFRNESVIHNTHTDGVNAVEENGHLALLARAKQLVEQPPERTTVLLFITGHMHQPAFSTKGRATLRWLTDHPEYWAGGVNQMTAVASTCVEHLGAINWAEDLATGAYFSTHNQTDEVIYANTQELVNITENHWNGAYPGLTRINNPIPKGTQSGEGEPLTQVGIPNMALCTVPLYLLTEWPEEFDERQLIDVEVVKRQVESFVGIWDDMDKLPTGSFGAVPPLKSAA